MEKPPRPDGQGSPGLNPPQDLSSAKTCIKTERSENDFHDAAGDGTSFGRNHDLEAPSAALDRSTPSVSPIPPMTSAGDVYSAFGRHQIIFIIVMASIAGFFSPVSANIYLPALNPLAKDLRVSSTLINLTVTSYMVCIDG
jgi:hypothetical protein